MKKLITLLLVSAFLFAVTIIPAHAAECEQHNYMYKGRGNIYEGTGDADGCDYRVWSKYECTRCGAVDYRGAGEIKKGSHLYYSVDLGHQPHNLHEYRRCCYRCPYNYNYSSYCAGPPCQGGIDSVLPEIK